MSNKTKLNNVLKWAKDVVQIILRHKRKCSMSSAMKELQTKTLRYQFKPNGFVKTNTDTTQSWQSVDTWNSHTIMVKVENDPNTLDTCLTIS